MNNTAPILMSVYVVFNLIVTRGLVLDEGLTGTQRLLQALLTWFVPVIGGCLVIASQGQNYTRREMKALMPFPFYLAGYVDRGEDPFKAVDSSVSAKDIDLSSGEGTCGGE